MKGKSKKEKGKSQDKSTLIKSGFRLPFAFFLLPFYF
jgi:hypothetical protein